MKQALHRNAGILLIVAAIVTVVWVNAGSLTPPGGPVAPTMKTLTEVEPRTIIDAVHTPSSAAALHVISQPGSFYLTGDIQGVPGKHGIVVESDHVSIDLRGFSVIGAGPGDFDGIAVGLVLQRKNIMVRNGTVRNWGRDGVNGIFGGSNCIYTEVLVSNNARNGLAANNATVTNCVAQDNSASGIVVYHGITTNCYANGNGQGFGGFFGVTITNCAAKGNGTGIFIGEGGIVTNCMISGSTGTGLGMGSNAVALNNDIDSCGNHGIELFFNPSGGRIEGNTVTRSTNFGINLAGGTNFIVMHNTARGNTGGNYNMVAGNSWGPIVNVAGVGDVSGTPNANHPLANLSY